MAEFRSNAAECREAQAPCYCRYPRQTKPQPAHIEIDPEERTLIVDYSGDVGGAVPAAVWHGRRMRLPVSPYVRGTAIADILEDPEFLALAERICAGHSVEWDGHNHVGRLSEDAQDAREEAERWLEDATDNPDNQIHAWESGDWLGADPPDGLTADTTDEELARLAGELEAQAKTDDVYLTDSMEECLRGLREVLREKADLDNCGPLTREKAVALRDRIQREDPRCQVTGFRRHASGSYSVTVVDTRTGIPFVLDTGEAWEQRKADSTLAAVPYPGDRAPAPAMLTVDEVADRLRLDRETIVRRIKAGKLRAYKPGGVYRIPPEAVEEYLRATEVKVPAPDELLTLPWADLTAAQRDEALALARERGTDEAEADRGAAGGIDQPTADACTYCRRVVERAFQAGHCPEALLQRWWREFNADPRVEAFCNAWAADMAEAAEQLAKVEAEVAEDVRHEKETRATLCPACEERLVDDVLCQPCLESGRYLTCKCGAWAAYDELRARHGDSLGGWAVVEEDEARYCPDCRPEDVEPGTTRLPQYQEEELAEEDEE